MPVAAQSVVAPATQLPPPLQVAAGVKMVPLHDAGAQKVPKE